MKQKQKIYTKTLPLVSKEYAEALDKLFPVLKPAPGVSRDDLLYNAGQRSVVDKILTSVTNREVTGNPDEIHFETKGSLLERIITGLKR